MKKKQIRKYVRDADDYMESIEKKLACMGEVLFFASMGMEYFQQKEDSPEARVLQLVREYLSALRNDEVSGLRKALEELKKHDADRAHQQ